MPKPDPNPSAGAADPSASARRGIGLFILLLLMYLTFIFVNVFAPDALAKTVIPPDGDPRFSFAGINFAIVAGFDLIVAALLLALLRTRAAGPQKS